MCVIPKVDAVVLQISKSVGPLEPNSWPVAMVQPCCTGGWRPSTLELPMHPWAAQPYVGCDQLPSGKSSPEAFVQTSFVFPVSAGESLLDVHGSLEWLVGGLEHQFYFPILIGFLIIPMDEVIFFRGVAKKTPTRNDVCAPGALLLMFWCSVCWNLMVRDRLTASRTVLLTAPWPYQIPVRITNGCHPVVMEWLLFYRNNQWYWYSWI